MRLHTLISMVEFDAEEQKSYPRYLQQHEGKILLERAVNSLRTNEEGQSFTFMVSEQYERRYHVSDTIQQLEPSSTVIKVKKPTAGAVCTLLLSVDTLDESPVLVASHDQVLQTPIDAFLTYCKDKQADAGLITFDAIHPKWTYVGVDSEGVVYRAAGQQPISRHASSGIYYFSNAKVFMEHCNHYILKHYNSNEPFLTNLVLNEYILSNQKVVALPIERDKIELYKKEKELWTASMS
ncbi:hypothetical protein JYU14_02420 [Simkania negevensis]|uniref:Nucleotidyl transferase domain-containing protein n=1 Tax=Simkania negevensis TaxID=83561 RepID=A0ABS3AQA9_9BACT|nr:hypothetical protein [Simkania negevensis]